MDSVHLAAGSDYTLASMAAKGGIAMARINFNDVSVEESRLGNFQRETGRSPDTEPTYKSYGTDGKPEYPRPDNQQKNG
jgi:hypothetical protein